MRQTQARRLKGHPVRRTRRFLLFLAVVVSACGGDDGAESPASGDDATGQLGDGYAGRPESVGFDAGDSDTCSTCLYGWCCQQLSLCALGGACTSVDTCVVDCVKAGFCSR